MYPIVGIVCHYLSHDVSVNDIAPCIIIDKQLVVYMFVYVM